MSEERMFEEHWKVLLPHDPATFNTDDEGMYVDRSVRFAWEIWKSARFYALREARASNLQVTHFLDMENSEGKYGLLFLSNGDVYRYKGHFSYMSEIVKLKFSTLDFLYERKYSKSIAENLENLGKTGSMDEGAE